MSKIVECVPNFSCGRDEKIIESLVASVRNTRGCTVVDVDPGKSTNRTVLTFFGDEKSVIDGAFNLCASALEMIDMSTHTGEHPRMGAVDVCPFIPVSNCTMDDCVEISKRFAERCGSELGIPMYLYEHSQTREYRKMLPQIREGQYEALAQRIVTDKWKPDFGPAKFIPSYGATVTGARMFLIAYNVNVLGTKEHCHRIALDVRTAGRGPGKEGKFQDVKGIGWYVDEYNMAQVSLNLNNYKVTGIHTVFEECKAIAQSLNVACVGSELVGLVPLESILDAADYYIQKENLFIVDEKQKVKLAIERLGLSSCTNFDPEKRIVEYLVNKPRDEPLVQSTVRSFVNQVGARTAAPGGGSVSALIAALGASLGSMAAWLTYGKRRFEAEENVIRENLPALNDAMGNLTDLVDDDTNAFSEYMDARKLPKSTEQEQKEREDAMQRGLQTAVKVPLRVMEVVDACWTPLTNLAPHTNPGCKSDVQVGARALEVGSWGAYQNVLINLGDIADERYTEDIKQRAGVLYKRAKGSSEAILESLEQRSSKL